MPWAGMRLGFALLTSALASFVCICAASRAAPSSPSRPPKDELQVVALLSLETTRKEYLVGEPCWAVAELAPAGSQPGTGPLCCSSLTVELVGPDGREKDACIPAQSTRSRVVLENGTSGAKRVSFCLPPTLCFDAPGYYEMRLTAVGFDKLDMAKKSSTYVQQDVDQRRRFRVVPATPTELELRFRWACSARAGGEHHSRMEAIQVLAHVAERGHVAARDALFDWLFQGGSSSELAETLRLAVRLDRTKAEATVVAMCSSERRVPPPEVIRALARHSDGRKSIDILRRLLDRLPSENFQEAISVLAA